jgi:tetratricopeptide (TPR) repeat protein
MDAVTYPQKQVVDFIQEHVIPVRVPFDDKPLAKNFNVTWTPTLVILDSSGQEHHRNTGFQAPEELLPMILLGIGKAHLDLGQFEEAIQRLDEVLANYPDSDWAPEAVYYRAVSRYKSTHKAEPLKEAYDVLRTQYPTSEWAKRAAPYRLL